MRSPSLRYVAIMQAVSVRRFERFVRSGAFTRDGLPDAATD